MTTFPPMAASIGLAGRVMQKKRVGPQDDDGDEDKDKNTYGSVGFLRCSRSH